MGADICWNYQAPNESPSHVFSVGGPNETYHVRTCDVLNCHEMLRANELFIGVPWEAYSSVATNIGFVSRHLRGVDLQHYRAPLLTQRHTNIGDWSFDPSHPRRFALANGSLHFYEIQEESRAAHQILSPVHVVSSSRVSFQQFQYNPVVSTLVVADSSNNVSILDSETMKVASEAVGAKNLSPFPDNSRNRRAKDPQLCKVYWNSDNTTVFASYNNGDCILIDPRGLNLAVLRQAFHHLNKSHKPVHIVPLAHQGFFLTSGHYGGNLEIKLWDQRKTIDPLQTIDLGSTSAPACLSVDEDSRHLFANARGDRILRHFSLYDSETHAPQLVLKDSHLGRANIRQLTMVPKSQWEHHRNEVSQLLKSDSTTIEVLHVYDKTTDPGLNIYIAPSPRSLTSSQGAKLTLSPQSTQSTPTSPRNASSELNASGQIPKSSPQLYRSLCTTCGASTRGNIPSNPDSLRSSQSTELPTPSSFSSAPETFDTKPLLTCSEFLSMVPLPERKKVPITPWGELTSDIAVEFANPELSDLTLSLSSGEIYRLHRCILAVRSPYFKKLLQASQSSSTLEIVNTISDVEIPAKVFERVLFYIYTDSLPIGLIREYPMELALLSELWGLFQLTRWLDAIKKNPDSARYHSFFQHQLNLLKTKPDSYFSDLTLVPGAIQEDSNNGQDASTPPQKCLDCQHGIAAKPLRSHKFFAGARNAFIRRLLASGMQESHSGEIVLDLISGPAMRAFISFLYSDTIEAEDPNILMELWAAGEAYFMPNLVSACEMHIRELVDFDNCVPLYERAGKSTTYLRTFLANYISSRFSYLDAEMKSYLDPEFRHDIESNFTPVKSTIVISSRTPEG